MRIKNDLLDNVSWDLYLLHKKSRRSDFAKHPEKVRKLLKKELAKLYKQTLKLKPNRVARRKKYLIEDEKGNPLATVYHFNMDLAYRKAKSILKTLPNPKSGYQLTDGGDCFIRF